MAEILADALRARDYDVDVVTSGAAALDAVSSSNPDIVLLDLGLPDLDGTEVCRRLRRWFRNPIVVLSADGDEGRKVAALDEGADDYLTKPFSMPELLARLRVATRHRRLVAAALDPSTLVVGDLHIDMSGHVATVDGVPLQLSRKEFALLALLARHCGRVLTRELLLSQIWNTTNPAKAETLRFHVNQLRRKLAEGPDRPRLVNEPGVGYRLLQPG
jgi:two-component system KDP operon response regulator KdpE